MMSLSYSKQQEIHEKVLSHFEELKHILKQIEVMEKEEKLIDIRSTVWFLKTATYCAFTIFALGLFIDLSMGLGKTIDVVYSAFVDDVLQYIVNLL
jgi:hypothetical protein